MFIIVQNTVTQIVISIFDQISQRDVWSAAHSPERMPRQMTDSSHGRSAAVVKPHHALAAYT